MKYTEITPTQAQQTYIVQPDQVKQNRLRNNIAAGIAKNRARPIPTADDLAMGFARYCQVQKQADRKYDRAQRAAANRLESKVVPDSQRPMESLSQMHEGADSLHAYIALVRVKVAGNTSNIRTQVLADGIAQARKLLQHLYGVGNVMAVVPALHSSRCSKVS